MGRTCSRSRFLFLTVLSLNFAGDKAAGVLRRPKEISL